MEVPILDKERERRCFVSPLDGLVRIIEMNFIDSIVRCAPEVGGPVDVEGIWSKTHSARQINCHVHTQTLKAP